MRLLCGAQLNLKMNMPLLNASEIAKVLSDNFLEELEFISDEIQDE